MRLTKINTSIYSLFKLSSLLSIVSLIACNSIDQKTADDSNIKLIEEAAFNSQLINANHFAFPDGKLKCLVMSFDDGPEHDRVLLKKLNEAGIVGTFHFNSGRLGERAEWLSSELDYDVYFVTEDEVSTIYNGHEVSGHTVNHLGLNDQSDSIVTFEVASDLAKLNDLIRNTKHQPVQGLAYPFGAYDSQTLKTLEKLGIKYARTTASTQNFELPASNFLSFHPTCHILDAPTYCSHFINNEASEMQLLNIWGHSYEFHDNWELADSICNLLGKKEDIWYAQTIELVDYLTAIKDLSYSNGSVLNPSKSTTVWIKNEAGNIVELLPGQSMPIHFQTSYAEVNELAHLYPPKSTIIRYHGEWTQNHYKERIAEFKNAPLNVGDIVFVGNSITEQGGNWGEKLNMENVRNRGISGDMTEGVIKRIDEITHYQPKAVFLLIGINDLFNFHYQKQVPSPEYVANNIIKIIKIIQEQSPVTKIYLQTILPTSEDYMIENINTVNSILKKQEKASTYQLINLFEKFVGDDGLMRPEFTSDGTHLNEMGYQLWSETIKAVYVP
ncbi:MAG: GDSL-type esterase/lipase family protein [Bacteroidota bacterium]